MGPWRPAVYLKVRKLTIWAGLDETRKFGSDRMSDALRGKACPTSRQKPGVVVPRTWVIKIAAWDGRRIVTVYIDMDVKSVLVLTGSARSAQ